MTTRWASLLVVSLVAFPGLAGAELKYVVSSTIGENIMPEAAEAFRAKTGIRFSAVEIQGFGKGLEMVLRGEAQFAGLSRSLRMAEKQRRMSYHIIGYDAVGVFVHPDNPVRSLTKQQLKAIYTGRIQGWGEVGGPGAPIVCIRQVWGAGRGQMIEFQSEVMDGAPYRADRKEVDRQPDQVAALLKVPQGITAVSFGFARPGIEVVAIEGFAPDRKHIRSGAYILSRPLLLLAPAHPNPEAKRFINFMLSPEGQEIVGRKFVPIR